ncbi:MAG: CPBP family intramembrane metalloprotease [Phycisphaerales bacterium]|nr:CPBP family intramembrane metalloprotease [Phycisphaerae bacterium]NNF43028.1 CPBP family intramembrane metalloprotease [Phycisphaerales bacterium]NNM25568.1 CPBP family intramembrane metalloprotease [Phycisphaerales bacterium]
MLQLAVFTFIPFVVYLVVRRRVRGFGEWIGLTRAPGRVLLAAAVIAVLFALAIVPLTRSYLEQRGTVTGGLLMHLNEFGWSPWLAGTILVTAWIKTGLSEEILFRGFIGKRLIAWLGFAWGNAIQAAIFGALHLLLVFAVPVEQRTAGLGAVMLLGPGAAGWLNGYLNHRWGKGSILPGWVMHGLGNTVAYTLPLFILE